MNELIFENKSKSVPEEVRQKISASLTGRTLSTETRRKMSIAQRNKKLSEAKKKIFAEKLRATKAKRIAEGVVYKTHKGRILTPEQRKKLSMSLKDRKSPNKGIPMSAEQKLKISKINKGRLPPNKGKPMSEEQKQKIRASLMGHKFSPESREKMRLSHLGQKQKPMSEASRKKLRDERLGGKWPLSQWKFVEKKRLDKIEYLLNGPLNPKNPRIVTEETRQKLSIANKGRPSANKGKPMSEEQKIKLRNHPSNKNRKISEVLREKLIRTHIGRPMSAYNRMRITQSQAKKREEKLIKKVEYLLDGPLNPIKPRKPFSEETKLKIGIANKGRIPWSKGKKLGRPSEETIAKIRAARLKQVFPIRDTGIEKKIQGFLNEIGIEYTCHREMHEIAHKFQCDLHIPKFRLIVECDGTYWHRFPDGRDIDRIRTNEMINAGFIVLRLWEHDINKMNLESFISRVQVLCPDFPTGIISLQRSIVGGG